MDKSFSPEEIAAQILKKDPFAQWLELKIEECNEGLCKVSMVVRQDMLNGLGMAHGGILFSLADSTFAFAANSRNKRSVAMDASINFIKPAYKGDRLMAEASEVHNGKSTGLYQISVFNQKNEQIALYKGLCFRTDHPVK
jgi:acyl-CoA thioesterase